MKNPPKDRSFLGLVSAGRNALYWDIFSWDGEGCGYTGMEGFEMPELIRWVDLPEIKESDYED